jgi:hypothetical protein
MYPDSAAFCPVFTKTRLQRLHSCNKNEPFALGALLIGEDAKPEEYYET